MPPDFLPKNIIPDMDPMHPTKNMIAHIKNHVLYLEGPEVKLRISLSHSFGCVYWFVRKIFDGIWLEITLCGKYHHLLTIHYVVLYFSSFLLIY